MESQNSNLKSQDHNAKGKIDLKLRTYQYSLSIIKLLTGLPNERVYWVIADQLLRSATSIGANVMEAKSASSKRDFIKFYEIALKSANETKYWLSLLGEGTSIGSRVRPALGETEQLANILAASLLTMKNKR
jgi:four helix bundle protein